MSFHKKNLQAFQQLLEKQSSLLSEQDKRDLGEQIVNCPEEFEQLSFAITAWYATRPQLLEEQLRILDTLITSEEGQKGAGFTPSDSSEKSAKESKNFIENLTRAGSPGSSSPLSDSQRSNQEKSDFERLNQ